MFKKDYKKSLWGKRKTPTWKNLLKKSLFVFYFLRFYAKLFHFTQTTASPICETTFPKWQQLRAATSPLLGSVPWRHSSRVEMGVRRWIWERIGSFCERVQEVELRVSFSLCNHREIQMSKAAIPLHTELGGAHSQGSALSLAEN